MFSAYAYTYHTIQEPKPILVLLPGFPQTPFFSGRPVVYFYADAPQAKGHGRPKKMKSWEAYEAAQFDPSYEGESIQRERDDEERGRLNADLALEAEMMFRRGREEVAA